jgi:hypothetical protein
VKIKISGTMKKTFLFLAITLLLAVFSTKTQAQFFGTFSIDTVVGLPDTLNANSSYTFGIRVRNVGNTTYSGSFNFDFYVDTLSPGTLFSFGSGQTGGFLPGDTVTFPISYTFSINNNTFNIGDNVVVVWPRALQGSTALDSLSFHVYIADLNGVDEKDKPTTDLKIFPNPAKDFLSFSSEKNKIEEVRIYDMSGRLVLQSKEHLKVFTGHLTEGIYIAEAQLSNGLITRRKIIAGKK